jgi:4-amino-4-deoxy-L-arabinose transferase-like glycosyltransferase
MAPLLPWRRFPSDAARRFCVIAAVVIIGLFSIASAKLIPYILPSIPPLAIIIADGIGGLMDLRSGENNNSQSNLSPQGPDWRRLSMVGPLLALIGLGIIALALDAHQITSPYPTILRPLLYGVGAIIIADGGLSFLTFRQGRLWAGLGVFIGGATLVLLLASYGRTLAEPTRSYAQLARTIEQRAPTARLICYPRYIQSLPFYCRRRVVLVGAKTELTYGAEHSRDGAQFFFDRTEDLLRLWRTSDQVVIVIDRSALPSLRARLGRFKVIASDSKKVALTRADDKGNLASAGG